MFTVIHVVSYIIICINIKNRCFVWSMHSILQSTHQHLRNAKAFLPGAASAPCSSRSASIRRAATCRPRWTTRRRGASPPCRASPAARRTLAMATWSCLSPFGCVGDASGQLHGHARGKKAGEARESGGRLIGPVGADGQRLGGREVYLQGGQRVMLSRLHRATWSLK